METKRIKTIKISKIKKLINKHSKRFRFIMTLNRHELMIILLKNEMIDIISF